MSQEPPFQLVDTEPARKKAQQLFARVRSALVPLLPSDVDIRHIGATAVCGCLTKGDLDIVVRVPGIAFEQVDALLARHFARNDGSIRTTSFAAFEDASADPHLGIQLTMIGGPHDFFHLFVEALQRCPELVSEYNTLKLQHVGSDMAVYRVAKDAFVERVLAGTGFNQ
ncbi:MAG: GrpB family protein [Hyphomicrobium sp.]